MLAVLEGDQIQEDIIQRLPARVLLIGEELSGALFPLGFCRERGFVVFLSIPVHGS